MLEFKIPKQLEKFDYLGERAYTITIFAYWKRKNFPSDATRDRFLRELTLCASKASFEVVAYAHFPSKIRMLVRGKEANSDLRAFVESFKHVTEKLWRKNMNEPLWCPGYSDHVLRKSEPIEAFAEAVRTNARLPIGIRVEAQAVAA